MLNLKKKQIMKRQYVSLLAILLTLSGFLFSCGDKLSKGTGALEFDSIQVNETAHLFGDTAKPACNLVINFAYAVKSSDEKLKDSLNTTFINACFGNDSIVGTPAEIIKAYTEKYVSDYRHDLEPMYTEDERDKEDQASIGAWYSYYKALESHVQYYEKNLLIYRINYNEYTGGAHGMYTTTYLNIDLRTLRPLQLNDLFVGDYQEALTDLLWNQLMADNGVATHEELEDLGYGAENGITLTENFYLDKDGITFFYNVYDIAPYAMGPVIIQLPYEIMSNLLNKDYLPLQ